MKRSIIVIILLALTVGGWYWWSNIREESVIIRTATIKNQRLNLTIASTPTELSRGLAGVTELDWHEGMLFAFPQRNTYRFWMKDMLMPIDIIWIRDAKVVDIDANIPPPAVGETKLPIYQSSEVVDQVIEVRAGFIDKYGVAVGDEVIYN